MEKKKIEVGKQKKKNNQKKYVNTQKNKYTQ